MEKKEVFTAAFMRVFWDSTAEVGTPSEKNKMFQVTWVGYNSMMFTIASQKNGGDDKKFTERKSIFIDNDFWSTVSTAIDSHLNNINKGVRESKTFTTDTVISDVTIGKGKFALRFTSAYKFTNGQKRRMSYVSLMQAKENNGNQNQKIEYEPIPGATVKLDTKTDGQGQGVFIFRDIQFLKDLRDLIHYSAFKLSVSYMEHLKRVREADDEFKKNGENKSDYSKSETNNKKEVTVVNDQEDDFPF